jgi:hypothetical protein
VQFINSTEYQAVIAKKKQSKADAELLKSVQKEMVKKLSLEQMAAIIEQLNGKA